MSVIDPVVPALPVSDPADPLSALPIDAPLTVPLALPIDAPVYHDPRDAFFDTSHLTKDLKRRTVRGGAVTLSAQAIKFVLRMGSTAILARLLTPADFGLIAMVTVVTGFVEMFKDAGLSMATVQREKITHAQVSTLFWINVALSVAAMIVIAALAPVIAWFYGEPRLTNLTLVLSCSMVFSGMAVQHQALLKRTMQFGRLAVIELIAIVAGAAVAAAMARNGMGYWSLVGMTGATVVTTAVMSMVLCRWIPGYPARGSEIRHMLGFGSKLTGFAFLNYFVRNGDNALIGWRWGAAALGLYSKAYGLLMLPLRQINAPLDAIAVPALSRLQSDPERYRRCYLQFTTLVIYLTAPLFVVMAFVADEMVTIILGAGWGAAGPLFKVLVVAAFFQPLLWTTSWILISQHQAGRLFRWGLLTEPAQVASFAVGLPWGPFGVASAYAICLNLLVLPTLVFTLDKSPIQLADVARCTARPYLLSAMIGVAAVSAQFVYPVHGLAKVMLGIFVAGCVTLACTTCSLNYRRDLLSWRKLAQ